MFVCLIFVILYVWYTQTFSKTNRIPVFPETANYLDFQLDWQVFVLPFFDPKFFVDICNAIFLTIILAWKSKIANLFVFECMDILHTEKWGIYKNFVLVHEYIVVILEQWNILAQAEAPAGYVSAAGIVYH